MGIVSVTNCHSSQPHVAIIEILNTQAQNVRATSDKNYHLIVSFRAGEQPLDATLKAIEARICEALGFGEHERVSAVHHDTDHLHLHIAINKIHPTRYTMHDPFNDFRTLGQLCEKLEREFGLERDNHQARKGAAENRAADMEHHAGVESLLGWIQRECHDQIRDAPSWTTLHQVMRTNGLTLLERGNGLVVKAGDGTAVKASSIGRGFSKPRLEARFGPFVPSPEQQAGELPDKTYEKRPVHLNGKNRGSTGINTVKLYARYKNAQQEAGAARAVKWARASARKNRRIDAAKRSARLKRALIKVIEVARPGKKLMYAATSGTLVGEIKQIGKDYLNDRQQFCDKHRRRTWADWLRTQAEAGDPEALAALRARAGAHTVVGNTVTGKGARQAMREHPPQDSVTKQGTIIYRMGAAAVRDDGDKLTVVGPAGQDELQGALRMAMARYGNCISVCGTAAFKDNIVRAVVAGTLTVTFDDAGLERRRQELLHKKTMEQHTHAPSIHTEQRRPASSSLVCSGAAAVTIPGAATPGATARAGSDVRKPDIAPIGKTPPPGNQNRLLRLSELGRVRIALRPEVLLSGHVPDQEQQGAAANVDLRQDVSRSPRTGIRAADQYIFEREQKRRAGFDIPKHSRCNGIAGPLIFAGIRKIENHGLALLKHGEDILVMPVDDATLQRLKLLAIGDAVTISARAFTKTIGRRR